MNKEEVFRVNVDILCLAPTLWTLEKPLDEEVKGHEAPHHEDDTADDEIHEGSHVHVDALLVPVEYESFGPLSVLGHLTTILQIQTQV